jgi:Flp pilus assembly pilin Flp
MQSFVDNAKEFIMSEEGPTFLEWAALAVAIIITVWLAITRLGSSVGAVFDDVRGKLGH